MKIAEWLGLNLIAQKLDQSQWTMDDQTNKKGYVQKTAIPLMMVQEMAEKGGDTLTIGEKSSSDGSQPETPLPSQGIQPAKRFPLKKVLGIGSAILAGATGLGGLGAWMMSDGDSPDDKSPAVSEQEQRGSLYQYLEDEGFHLPDE